MRRWNRSEPAVHVALSTQRGSEADRPPRGMAPRPSPVNHAQSGLRDNRGLVRFSGILDGQGIIGYKKPK